MSKYILCPPSAFDFKRGYTYVKLDVTPDGDFQASTMPSGFYDGVQTEPETIEFDYDSIELYKHVSEGEAIDGIGTYMAAMVLVIDENDSRTDPIWRYGTINWLRF